jgi:hypothetical protein
MSDNDRGTPLPPTVEIKIRTNGLSLNIDSGGVPPEFLEAALLRALHHISREMIVGRLAQVLAVRDQQPRIYKP